MANNTTTVLNVGTAGDSMDESSATQPIDVTQPAVTAVTAKRPRVVIGDDTGNLLDLISIDDIKYLPTHDTTIVSKLDFIARILRSIDGHLAHMTERLPFDGSED